jgi:hypothetical protein
MGASGSGPAHFPARVRRVHARPGSRVGTGETTPPVGTTILTAGRRRLPYAGPHHHEMYIVRAPARVRVLDPPFVAVVYLARGGGLPAMSVAGSVERPARNRTAPLCARAAPDLGHPLGPGQGQGSAPGLGLTLGLVLALVPPARARAPRHTLRILGVAVGPDPTAGVVEAIVETISGTAGLARLLPPKIHDGRTIRLHCPCFPLRVKSSDMRCRLPTDYVLSLLRCPKMHLNIKSLEGSHHIIYLFRSSITPLRTVTDVVC